MKMGKVEYELEMIREVEALALTTERAYNLTSAVYQPGEEKGPRYKKLVPIMLNCCLG